MCVVILHRWTTHTVADDGGDRDDNDDNDDNDDGPMLPLGVAHSLNPIAQGFTLYDAINTGPGGDHDDDALPN